MSVDNRRDGPDDPLIAAAAGAFPDESPAVVGVALSGGGDSTALLHLMQQAAPVRGWRLAAVTVDHALRAGSADEAALAGERCRAIGVPHDTLLWAHGPVAGNVMDRARTARFRLIAGWARSRGIGHIVLGHTADDQAETFLMGLSREAGIDGLSGMRPSWETDGLRWARPLLGQGRAALRAYLGRHGIAWIEDPTNDDPAYTRIRARRALRAMAPLGITGRKLARVAQNLDTARAALDEIAAREAARIVSETAGALTFDRVAFAGLPLEIRRRLVIAALRWLSGEVYPPREAALARLLDAIATARDATLGGCRIRAAAGSFRMMRELAAVADLASTTDALWDGRWRVEGPHVPGLAVRALGPLGLAACPGWRATGLPRDVLVVSPAVWRGDALVAAPLAGVANGWTARIAASFSRSILSH